MMAADLVLAALVLVLVALTWGTSRLRAWRDGRVAAAAERADQRVQFHKANVEGGKRA